MVQEDLDDDVYIEEAVEEPERHPKQSRLGIVDDEFDDLEAD